MTDYLKAAGVTLALTVSLTMLVTGYQQHQEVDKAFSNIDEVRNDLADGSLDNFTEQEARLIVSYSGSTASMYGVTSSLWMDFGVAGLFITSLFSLEWFKNQEEEEKQ